MTENVEDEAPATADLPTRPDDASLAEFAVYYPEADWSDADLQAHMLLRLTGIEVTLGQVVATLTNLRLTAEPPQDAGKFG